MGRSKSLPRKRSHESTASVVLLGRQSLPSDISIDAMMMIEVEQARIAQQHRSALHDNDAAPHTPEATTPTRKRRKRKKKKTVSFGLDSIIGPPEVEMIQDDYDDSVVWKIHPRELPFHEQRLVLRTVECPNIKLTLAGQYHLKTPQSSVDVISKAFPSMDEDQRRSFYRAVQERHVSVRLELQQDSRLWVSMDLTEIGWNLIRSRKMSSHQKPIAHLQALLLPLYPDLKDGDDDGTTERVMTAGQFYKLVDNRQLLKKQSPATFDTPIIPGLKPTLRPYQSAAVEWMVRRERNHNILSEEWKLAWVVLHRQSGRVQSLCNFGYDANDDDIFYHCPFTGWFAESLENAQEMTVSDVTPIKGGILAESMGLGKTVEVLACILSNHCPQEAISEEVCTQNLPSYDKEMNERSNVVAEAADGLQDYNDEVSMDGDVRPRTGQQAIAVVTPERRAKIPECWSDDDILGGCICGQLIRFSKPSSVGEVVVCRSCMEPMHYECAYIGNQEAKTLEKAKFRRRFSNAAIRGYYCSAEICSSCGPEIKTKGTLIVSPIAILNQWEREIKRHTELGNKESLKVIVYQGIKNAAGDRSQSKAMHPRYLATADIVLASFEALRTDLGHVENSYGSEAPLRRRKRYRVARSPLVSLLWWRICLDEAQRVESTATGAARVALSLKSVNRWCVSGTPIGRGKLDDLYGLLLFLGVRPFDNSVWFRRCVQKISKGSEVRVMHLLRDIFWRSTKELESVRTQMNIPEQTENRVILKLSSVEKHFYNKQLERTLQIAGSLCSNHGNRRKTEAKLISNQLHMLRAACCHPQVGSRGIASIRKRGIADKNSVDSRVMTMRQILDKLILDAKLQCEEAQRLAIMHTNAMAVISRLKVEARHRGIASCDNDESLFDKSCQHYMESLQLAEENATPTMVMGEINVHGSVGLVCNRLAIQRGLSTLEWRSADDVTNEYWVSFIFSTEQRSVSEIRLRQLFGKSQNMVAETSPEFKWRPLRPERIELQCAGQNDEFTSIETLMVPHSMTQTEDWTVLKGFRTRKSKTWRIVIKVSGRNKQNKGESDADGSFLRFEVELYEASIAHDPLQRLHCLHNAAISFRALSNLKEDQEFKPSGHEKSRKEELLQKSLDMAKEASSLEKSYLDRTRGLRKNVKVRFQVLSEQRQDLETNLHCKNEGRNSKVTDCWQSLWWDHFLVAAHLKGSEKTKRLAYERLLTDLDGSIQGEVGTSVRDGDVPLLAFSDLNGFLIVMRMRLQSIRSGLGDRRMQPSSTGAGQMNVSSSQLGRFCCPVGAHASCMRNILNISDHPTVSEMAENSCCMVCKADWNQTGPTCQHCKLGMKLEDLVPDRVTLQALRSIHGLLRGPLGRSVLGKDDREKVLKQASCFFEVLDLMTKERLAAQRFWRVHLDYMNDLDELRQCKTAMRLTYENENLAELTDDEQNGVVVPCDLYLKYSEHTAKQAMALGNLKRCKGTLNYLKGLGDSESNQSKSESESEQVTCMICLGPFDGDRAVLRCGHSVHVDDCLERLRARYSNGRSIACPLRCRDRSEPSDILVASNRSHHDGSRIDKDVKGSFGTKVSRLVSDILKMRQKDEKGVVFSQWDDMIEIISSALKENNIPFVVAAEASKIGRQVETFRSSDCSVLLLNAKSGGEGLTLLEANHVFMVEPFLNTGLDRQAINRIHRIGQKRKTYIWRYIVQDTIETKVDALRTSQLALLGEDPSGTLGRIGPQRGSYNINAGGIDGFFSTEDEILDLLQQ